MSTTGPPISGIVSLAREIEDLKRRVSALETQNGRSLALGNTYRIEAQGTGVTATLHAIRTGDNNDKLLAP